MESLDNSCFVCDKTIMSDKWKYKLKTTATKETKVPVSDLIQLLVGDEFEVIVGERDAVCNACMKYLNEMDALSDQLAKVKARLTRLLSVKYGLTPDDNEVQIKAESSKNKENEMFLVCEKCNFITENEKEFNQHMKIHSATSAQKSTSSANAKKPERSMADKRKSNVGNNKKRNSIETMIKQAANKHKRTQKKVKMVFQCSICNLICKSKGAMTNHVRIKHGSSKIIVTESDDEYEDIQTLDDELANTEKKPDKPKLDFLEDWDDEDSNDIPSKKPKIDEPDLLKNNEQMKSSKVIKQRDNHQKAKEKYKKSKGSSRVDMKLAIEDLEEDQSEDFDGISSKPTCMFCHAKFFSVEAVKDHVKLTHGKNQSNLNFDGLSDQKGNVLARIGQTSKNKGKSTQKDSMKTKKLYRCNFCGIRKVPYQLIQMHINEHKRQVALKCKFCGSKLRSLASFKAHRTKCRKTGRVLRKCKHCNLFLYANDIKQHVRNAHILPKRRIFGKYASIPSTIGLNKLKEKINYNKVEDIGKSIADLESKEVLNQKASDIKCDLCEVQFAEKEHLLDHKIKHKMKDCLKFGVCIWCSKLFNDEENLKIHNEKVHGAWLRKKSCSLCSNKEFLSKREFKLHFLKSHFPEETQTILKQISECKVGMDNEAFSISKVMKEFQDLTGEGSDVDEFKTSKLTYFCPVCDFHNQNGEEVKNHLVTHTENYCNICQGLFKRKVCLAHGNLHSRKFLGEKCSLCDNSFHDDIHLMNHLQINHSECKNKCNICANSFATHKDLINHRFKIHGEKLPHVKTCRKCEMKFYTQKSFQNHEEFAHRSSLRSCKFCDKTFSSLQALLVHEKTHLSKEKSAYKCHACGKVLKTLVSLKMHKINHDGVSLLICETCGKQCKSQLSFREHKASHLEGLKKKHYCKTCDKGFYFYDTQVRHCKVHTSLSLYKCRLCQSRFPNFIKLKDHIANCSPRIKLL